MVEPLALQARGPLDGRALPASDAFAARLAPAAARFILRGDTAAAEMAGAVFGPAPPTRPLGSAQGGTRFALWLGPDEWLLAAPGEDPAWLAPFLEQGLAAAPHSLVDVSQRQIGLELSGANAALVLNAGCPLDLGLAAFPVGAATRTMLAKAEIVLWRRETSLFHVEVWRSFADYAVSFLAEAARRAPKA